MKPAAFAYHAPESTGDVVGLLREHGDDAKVLAGGQSLVPMLALRLTSFPHLVDVNRVTELAGIERQNGMIGIGAVTRQSAVERDASIATDAPLLAKAVKLIGHFQIRNRGTVGGSIAHADPAAELPVVALTLDAELEVANADGTRRIPASEFFVGTWTTSMESDDLLVRAWFPTKSGRSGFAFEEVARRLGDFGLAGAAAAVELADDDTISKAAIGLLGMGPTPLRALTAESALVGTRGEAAELEEIGRLAAAGADPPGDVHASVRYRQHVGAYLVGQAVGKALEEGRVVDEVAVTVTVNGERRRALIEARKTLADFIREDCALTGTHLGCEHGVCGACTVLVDGEAVRSCLLFAVQAEGAEVTTIEGLTPPEGLNDIQEAFRQNHGLQCGFCTPGFIVSIHAFLEANPTPSKAEIREGLSGNLCRCTGYQGIIKAVESLVPSQEASA